MGRGFGHQITTLATATDLSSHNWTPLPGNPDVLNPAFRPVLPSTADRWINSQSSYHGIQRLPNGTWVAFLRGTGGEVDDGGQWLQDTTKIGIATSNDGIHWNHLPQNPILQEGNGGPPGDYTPEFIGYLGNDESGQDEYLLVWNEAGKIQYGRTTDFVNIQRDPRGHASWPSYGGADDVRREGNTLYPFTGRYVHTMALSVATNRPPTVPGFPVAANLQTDQATVSWGRSIDADDDDIVYEIQYRKDELNDHWTTALTTKHTSYTLTGLQENTSYHVRMRAFDGQLRSAWRSANNLFTTTLDNQPPTVPGPLSAIFVSQTTATVLWETSTDPNNDPLAYQVEYRQADLSDSWTPTVLTTALGLPLSELESGTHYRVRVRSFDGTLYSDWRTSVDLFTTLGMNVPGDMNDDGVVNAEDIDLVQSAIHTGNTDSQFDIDGNSLLNSADVFYLVETILNTRIGDLDVDTTDLTVRIINFTGVGGTGKGWAEGDNDGDGDVDTLDLTSAIINFTGAMHRLNTPILAAIRFRSKNLRPRHDVVFNPVVFNPASESVTTTNAASTARDDPGDVALLDPSLVCQRGLDVPTREKVPVCEEFPPGLVADLS